MYKLCYFVPVDYAEATKAAIFAAGGGKIGDYDCCAWQVLGQGQFRPLAGSQPFIGEQGEIERVEEYRVEMVCSDGLIVPALKALKQAHPYEEPAYEVYRLEEM
ncbi:MAG: NGG1p interacting factor NIF3 [Halomonadaceae bacterium]|nr:MAG: NGG1p interacting factor NIF3 [Halomonadaceae bacterium]